MKIGCLGWGSLIWDPRELPIQNRWFQDGPLLPIEFTRLSADDRITLVLTPGMATVKSLWTLMTVNDLNVAKEALANRERTRLEYIGKWSSKAQSQSEYSEQIGRWAYDVGLDTVIWTALPPKWNNQSGLIPTIEEVIVFLKNLSPEKQKNAEEYIRKTPRQINTEYRKKIEEELIWMPIDLNGH